jgi:sugar/nucleoside kinase (ribokinase family)
VAVSHGGAALDWWTPEGSGSIRPEQVKAVDTTGAGDVLHGAYCLSLAAGLDRVAALRSAVAVATQRVQLLGPFAWRSALA